LTSTPPHTTFEGKLDVIRKSSSGKVIQDAGGFEICVDSAATWTMRLKSPTPPKKNPMSSSPNPPPALAPTTTTISASTPTSTKISLSAHEGSRVETSANLTPAPTASLTPQIYMQDDDVEFGDLDDDDPDDDLDL
jgi:hypothetical protein